MHDKGAMNAPFEKYVNRYTRTQFLLMVMAALGYAALVIKAGWSGAYIDFGDGNYMYIASRIADGIVPYRDILAPQPPCHLMTGAGLVWIADQIGIDAYYAFRFFSLILHLASGLLVASIARRAWGMTAQACIAFILYLFLPLGLWWSLGYQSEPLEIFFLLLAIRFAIVHRWWADLLTGVFAAAAAFTNATAAPVLLILILFMLVKNFMRAILMAAPAIAIAVVAIYYLEQWTEGNFLQNVVLNQVGTYPEGEFFSYAAGKLHSQGLSILYREGIFIFFALLGLFRFLRTSPLDDDSRGGLGWFCFATFLSFLYVTKGGTMDYVFSLAGPAIAILAAGEFTAYSDLIRGVGFTKRFGDNKFLELMSAMLMGFFITAIAMIGPLHNSVSMYGDILSQRLYELPKLQPEEMTKDGVEIPNIDQVTAWIEAYSKPGDTILAPPFYAFMTGRVIWGEYSEIFIWNVKNFTDRARAVRESNSDESKALEEDDSTTKTMTNTDLTSDTLAPEPDQAEIQVEPQGEGWLKVIEMAKAIENREIPIVIIEMAQTGASAPEVMRALAEHYRPLTPEPYPTRNTQLAIFVPK